MKHHKLKTGKGELNSTNENYLCGLVLGNLQKTTLPPKFQPRRSDTIIDRDILLSQIGLLCNGCNDFNDMDLYRGDEVFMNAYNLNAFASESVFRQRFDNPPANKTHAALRKLNARLLALRTFGRVDADGLKLVPVDMDISPARRIPSVATSRCSRSSASKANASSTSTAATMRLKTSTSLAVNIFW